MTSGRVREATWADVADIDRLIRELAVYEREPDAVEATADDLATALFGPDPRLFALVAEVEGAEVRETEVHGAEVEGAEVEGAEVEGAEVEGAEVDGAEVEGAEVDGAEVEGAEVEGAAGREVVGMALWFVTYSTWRGRHGIWLEDLFAEPRHRGLGLGRALLATLAATCTERGWARLEWSVLDWNEPARGFYRSLGATPQDDWTTWRLDGEALGTLGSAQDR